MTTKKTNLSEYNPDMIPSGKDLKIGIVVSEWNATITNSLLEGAYSTLIKHGVADENMPLRFHLRCRCQCHCTTGNGRK